MNLEMPSPAETDSLRKILLIVLGIMIVTIPVICAIVLAKIKAQRQKRPVVKPAVEVEGGVTAQESFPKAGRE